jgi:hypothetical protein
VRWVVVDAGTYALHPQATAHLASLRSRGCSANTERAYAGVTLLSGQGMEPAQIGAASAGLDLTIQHGQQALNTVFGS